MLCLDDSFQDLFCFCKLGFRRLITLPSRPPNAIALRGNALSCVADRAHREKSQMKADLADLQSPIISLQFYQTFITKLFSATCVSR